MAKTNDIKRCADMFKRGNVVLFPTDTVVGLGCRFDSHEGIARIRQMKGIVEKNPLAVLISDEGQLDELRIRRSRLSNALMKRFWPGGLTIVMTAEESYPCSGERNSLGLRMPDVESLRRIIEMVGVPIAATSANLHGEPAPVILDDVQEAIRKHVDCVIDLEVVPNGLPSTVVKIEGGVLRVQREGSITEQEILDVAGRELERR